MFATFQRPGREKQYGCVGSNHPPTDWHRSCASDASFFLLGHLCLVLQPASCQVSEHVVEWVQCRQFGQLSSRSPGCGSLRVSSKPDPCPQCSTTPPVLVPPSPSRAPHLLCPNHSRPIPNGSARGHFPSRQSCSWFCIDFFQLFIQLLCLQRRQCHPLAPTETGSASPSFVYRQPPHSPRYDHLFSQRLRQALPKSVPPFKPTLSISSARTGTGTGTGIHISFSFSFSI